MSAYLDALKMLARRELSEAQVRQRLARRGHAASEVDHAVERLRGERAIDDARVADVIARAESTVRHRGRKRVVQAIERAGVSPADARRAADRVFAEVDPDQLLTTALNKRLRGRERIADQAELARLYRHLVGQGFEPDRVMAALRRLSRDNGDVEYP